MKKTGRCNAQFEILQNKRGNYPFCFVFFAKTCKILHCKVLILRRNFFVLQCKLCKSKFQFAKIFTKQGVICGVGWAGVGLRSCRRAGSSSCRWLAALQANSGWAHQVCTFKALPKSGFASDENYSEGIARRTLAGRQLEEGPCRTNSRGELERGG